ncbi:alpha-amylase family glycosyl hydrolase [Deinococcus fonticola]|uniref:alpha-amylase family glycosyl hydrolase n=1 Tax=Deinococcus fonticola TaxID=2528713 RepID=UPI001F0DF260|nr:alpha-amylase family glycosyl hydrolase [Deinococcus fonticola]
MPTTPPPARITPEVQHDHTPAYTEQLGAPRGDTVRVRLRTTLDVTDVKLKFVHVGEIETVPAHAIASLDGQSRWFEATLPLHEARMRYAWQLNFADDHLNFTSLGLHHSRRGFRNWFQYLTGCQPPTWAWEAFFYQIFPDRFRNGDPTNDVQTGEYLYQGRPVEHVAWDTPIDRRGDIHAHYGGDLNGVTQALPYLRDLGITGLWLTPVFVSPSNHRYDITDYRRIDPHLGGQAAWDELVAHADQSGIRIVLDGVFNHMGNENALFQAALAQGDAPERQLFTWRDEPGKPPYHSFFDVPTLPKIDYGNEFAVQEFLSGEESVVRHWLRRGAAGWRLDVAHMIGVSGTDQENLTLHRALKSAARQERPDAYVFGERFYDPELALDGQGEDGSMNYHGFGLPVMQWLSGQSIFGEPSRLAGEELVDILWDAYHALPPQVALSMFNLLESHDIGRAHQRLGESRRKFLAAFTLLCAYPGVPCTYYGSEVGVTQSRAGTMPWCREPMPWDESRWDKPLLEQVKRLIRVRLDTPVLHSGALRFIHAEADAIAFLRETTDAQGRPQRAVALASRRADTHPVTLHLPGGPWRDTLTGEAVPGGTVTLDACGGRLLLHP